MTTDTVSDREELFLEERHLELERCMEVLSPDLAQIGDGDPADAPGRLLRRLAEEGLLKMVLREPGGAPPELQSVCIVRQALARTSVLADEVFGAQMQGAYPLWLAGTPSGAAHLDGARSGKQVAALAAFEPGMAGDLAAITTAARRDGDSYVLDGNKAFIRSAGPATFYTVLARTGEGDEGLSFFVVDAGQKGLQAEERRQLGSHPVVDLRLDGCRIGSDALLGPEGAGLDLARRSQAFCAPAEGAAALGMGSRALAEALAGLRDQADAGSRPAVPQGTQHALADMDTGLEGGRLLVQRAAAEHDAGRSRPDLSFMAKLFAVETAGRVVDAAVQVLGEGSLQEGAVLEGLYREVRSRRFQGGATELQRDRIAQEILGR